MIKIKDKDFLKREIKNILLVLAGCFVLAFADAIFIIPSNIVNGGVDSLSIIINYYLEPILKFNVTDFTLIFFQLIFWILGIIFLGKRFSLHTLLGTIMFPLFYTIMLRIDLINLIGINAIYLKNTNSDGSLNLALLMMSGLFGGALSGVGVALTFLGNGSTGGTDVISFIIAKYSDVKQDVSGFILDASLIILGLICFKDWELGLVGILSAFSCALAVQYIFVYGNSYIIADIISDQNDLILNFIHQELGHGSTLVNVIGGYSQEKRKMVRVLILKVEMNELKNFIGTVDPKALVTFTQAKTINGFGFEPFMVSKQEKKKIIRKYIKKDKNKGNN